VTTENKLTVTAKAIVVATNSPINDRYVIHTKQAPYTTYVIGLQVKVGTSPTRFSGTRPSARGWRPV
jgi:hypothetical protein